MRTYVVCHSVTLVAYLVAATLRIRFGRLVNIYIIERFSPITNSSNSSVWCGVSTVSIGRIPFWDSLKYLLLAGILRDVLIEVDSIHIHEQGENQHQENKPIISARESLADSVFGIFYHPQLVIDRLKQFLAYSPNVFFLSTHRHKRDALNYTALPLEFTSDLVWIDFEDSGGVQLNERSEQAPYSTCTARILTNRQKHKPEIFRAQEPMIIIDALWLPMYRASAGLFGELMLTHESTIGLRRSFIRISNSNLSNAKYEKCMNFDLLWGIRACGYVLECLKEIPDSVPLRL